MCLQPHSKFTKIPTREWMSRETGSISMRVTCRQIMPKTMTCDYKEGKSLRACEIFSTLLGWSPSILRRFSSFLVQIARLIKAKDGSYPAHFAASVDMDCNAKLWRAMMDGNPVSGLIYDCAVAAHLWCFVFEVHMSFCLPLVFASYKERERERERQNGNTN